MKYVKVLNRTEKTITIFFTESECIANIMLEGPLDIRKEWRSIMIDGQEYKCNETEINDETFMEIVLIIEQQRDYFKERKTKKEI